MGLARAVDDLAELLDATRQIVTQTRQRVAGDTPDGATRRVSLHDGDARPIAKGRLGRPVEFGQKAQMVDNDDGVVLDHSVEQGNPPDAPQRAPAVARVKKRAGRTPGTVTADRGYGEAKVDRQLTDLGVKNVVIPRKGRPSQARRTAEHRKVFRRIIKWRTGSEGRISHLKRGYGWGPHPHRRHRGHPDLDRTLSPGPQPGQDQRPRRVTGDRRRISGQHDRQRHQHQIQQRLVFQVEVANSRVERRQDR
jgi:IS5 family transposase